MLIPTSHKTSKELWDALDENFGVSDADAGSELYLMEQLYD